MLKTKMIRNSSILRLIALVTILSFSFEMATLFIDTDEVQIEIVDVDLEDDVELDDEINSIWNFSFAETTEIAENSTHSGYRTPTEFSSQFLMELPTPPPDVA